MTYLDFINSVGISTFKSCIENYFDQLMLAYKLCGMCDLNSININGIDQNNQEVSLEILFANDRDITALEYILSHNSNLLDIYGVKFIIYYNEIDLNTLEVKIKPCSN